MEGTGHMDGWTDEVHPVHNAIF